jgi:putative hydrolase of the HAD superfamily
MDIAPPHKFDPFRCVETWIFDLDNTLYPSQCNLFAQIDQRMTAFIERLFEVPTEEARRLQKEYYYKFGTTLGGLMALHGIKPEQFLEYVHDIDLSPIEPLPALSDALARLPGRKFIFTNGSRLHAERVATKLGVLQHFDGLFDITASDYVPKPRPEAYSRFLSRHGVIPTLSAMFEDLPHNLENPHERGMTTVLVRSTFNDHPCQQEFDAADELPAHIHHVTDDLTNFLQELLNSTALTKVGPSAPSATSES